MLVDDGSKDGTAEIARRTIPDEDILKIVRTADNPIGLGPARNFGFKHVTGDFYWLMDADDWLFPHTLKEVFAKLKPEIDCLYVNFTSDLENLTPIHPKNKFELASMPVGVWNKIFKKSIWHDFPSYIPEDVAIHFLNIDKVNVFDVVDTMVYFYNRKNPSAISRTFDECCNPHHLLQMVAESTLEQKALKYEWLSGIFHNFADMLSLKYILKDKAVRTAWWARLMKEYQNLMCGRYVH